MRSFSRLSLILLVNLSLCAYSATGQEVPKITAEEIPGYEITRNQCFNGGSLWGYMNGGADIYLEYGFDKLRAEEFSNEGETIKLELFLMLDPASAFGIYSIKTFNCSQSNVSTDLDCLNPYSFQLVYGKYYIQIINESGSEKAKQRMIKIAETLLKKLEPAELVLPIFYLTDSLNMSLFDIKMVKGELGIQNKIQKLASCFEGIENFQIYYAKREVDGEFEKYYEVFFDSPEVKNTFLGNIKDKNLQLIKENEVNILIQE